MPLNRPTATVAVDVQAGTTLTGTTGKDTLISSSGNQTMTGGAGADTFVFAGTIGHDTIADFTHAVDKINIDHNVIADYATLISLTDDTSGSSVVTVDANNSITLANVLKTALTANDFHFV